MLALSAARRPGLAASEVPRRIKRPGLFALNLFSGMRRTGDIQWHLEFMWPASECAIYCLSIDIAIDAERGDLTQHHVILECIGHVAARRVLNSGGGLPVKRGARPGGTTEGPPL